MKISLYILMKYIFIIYFVEDKYKTMQNPASKQIYVV